MVIHFLKTFLVHFLNKSATSLPFLRYRYNQPNQKTKLLEVKTLIKLCKQNNYQAQMQVYNRYKDAMYSASLRVLKNPEDAQDVVQDAFIKGFKSIATLDQNSNLGGWLCRIAINRSLDLLRAQKKLGWAQDTQVLETLTAQEDEPEDYANVSMEMLQKALNKLKDHYKLIITLYLIEDYSHKEIAQQLAIKESTVRNQYRRAKLALQKILSKQAATWN